MNDTIIPSFYFSNKFLQYENFIQEYSAQKIKFSKNDILTTPGEINNTAYYINSGIMLFSLSHANGGQKSLALLGPGSIFPIGLTDHKYKMDFEIILTAFSNLDVYKFSYITLREMAEDNRNLSLDLLEYNCDFISYLFHNSVSQAFDSCLTRLCDVLYLYLVSTDVENNTVNLSQSSLANFTGASIAQLERALKELRTLNIIDTSRNKIIILDSDRLLDRCSENVRNF